MTIVAKPIGRGNWSPLRLVYAGPQMAPFTARIGETFTVAGVTWRVCRVEA